MTRLCFIAAAFILLSLSACNKTKPRGTVYRMGDRVQTGSLIYNVLETEWKSELGESPSIRVPKNRFLIIRLTVTNSGGRAASIPSLILEDSSGRTYPEENNGEGVNGWLGIIRRVDPAQTDDGRVVFDVAPGAYRLRVSDDVDVTQTEEKYSLVDIPLNLETGNPVVPTK